jgi:uncharacterized OsmC-like protein
MKYSASVHSVGGKLDVLMTKGDQTNSVDIEPQHSGFGSSISGGEILFLAIATCYCNDLYREGRKLGIKVDNVEVDVDGDFMAAGEPALNVKCRIKVTAQTGEEEILKLVEHTDSIAEIPMSLRNGAPVSLTEIITASSQ